ncbi:MAG: class I SAM-dependent rRNA methyltransferase [Gammaproteobacteria bacterium]|nr:class I SAM-dependent rRNA methyltransferase [Gammaproteobacteria bacterium]
MSSPRLQLKKNESRRLRGGHLWVFSNEIDTTVTDLKSLEPGESVEIVDERGKFIANGYANPHSLICARIVSRDPAHQLDRSLLVHRLNIALSLRERLFDKPYYRLVHGEGDALPGLVVDRFGDVAVVQITTAGMERVTADILEALNKVLRPSTIILRNDASLRQLEGLAYSVEVVQGEPPEGLVIEENGTRFLVDPIAGQKTGWFFDHRMNRCRMQDYVRERRVLDLFSYTGSWGVQAAVAGASDVMCVDASATALDMAYENAALNGQQERLALLEGDAFEALKALREERERFDVVILDPPAFIKRKKDAARGLEAYERINRMAMQVLAKDGILISASCSHHLQRDKLPDIMLKGARHIDREMQLLEEGHQGPDHPIHPAIPETRYIKCFTARILPAR